jgi:hypothetical protein
MRGRIGGVRCEVDVNVAGLAGFLLARVAAAYGCRNEKDWPGSLVVAGSRSCSR